MKSLFFFFVSKCVCRLKKFVNWEFSSRHGHLFPLCRVVLMFWKLEIREERGGLLRCSFGLKILYCLVCVVSFFLFVQKFYAHIYINTKCFVAYP